MRQGGEVGGTLKIGFFGVRVARECFSEITKFSVRPEPRRRAQLLGSSGRQRSNKQQDMTFWVYILRCADNSYYTGHTDNLEERIAKHQSGEIEGYTSTRLPVTLLFSEEFPTREEALACERQIKGWSRRKH